MRISCRCNRATCQARRVLAKRPGEYRRPPRCNVCKRGLMRPDGYRASGREARKAHVCDPIVTGCGGYSFPHAHGRGWCDHNPRLTLADLEARSGLDWH